MITAQHRDGVLRLARAAEAGGFDSLWAGDHISFYVPILESLTLLSFVAGATERVKIGSSVYLLPLRHPTTTAKVVSTLDVLSGGRLHVRGRRRRRVPARVRGERRAGRASAAAAPTRRSAILRRLWSEDGVAHEGRHFRFGPISMDPKPVRPGGPPIIVGGRKPPALRRAGRLGDGYISHMCAAETYAQNLDVIRRHAEEAGPARRAVRDRGLPLHHPRRRLRARARRRRQPAADDLQPAVPRRRQEVLPARPPGRLPGAAPGLRRRRLPPLRALAADGPGRVRGPRGRRAGARDPGRSSRGADPPR